MGVFTQDLAQELDVSARAMDLVLDYARGGTTADITISNQDARGVMGRLGLGDEKPLRNVGALSGGEKARVALSMFALKPSNLLLLDEVSCALQFVFPSFSRCELIACLPSIDSQATIWMLNASRHLETRCRRGAAKMDLLWLSRMTEVS